MNILRKISVGSALVASLLNGCGPNNSQGESSPFQTQPQAYLPQPSNGINSQKTLEELSYTPYNETHETKAEALSEDRLVELYGKNATKYALQIVDNGRRIRESPEKQKNLYGRIESGLKKKFPLITPPKLFGFIDEPKEAENVAMLYSAREKVLSRAKKDKVDLPMSLIIASLCNEGYSLDGDNNLNGFGNFGLDTFGTEFDNIVARGYLPSSFKDKFEVSGHVNELGKNVKSANFESKAAAFEAFTATLAHRQYLFLEDLRKNKISSSKIPREQINFFTYKYYNGGPNSAEKLMRKKSAKEIDKFFKRVITHGSTGNSYVVLSGAQWLDLSGATDSKPEGKYWWSK